MIHGHRHFSKGSSTRGIRARIPGILSLAICAFLLSCHSSRSRRTTLEGAESSDALTRAQPFGPGREVNLNLNVGDVDIQPAPGDHELRLVIYPRGAVSGGEMQSWIHRFDVNDRQADIRLQLPKLKSTAITLYVPASTALNIRLGVGNLVINGISGDKYLSINVGNLTLKGLRRDDYAAAKVRADLGNIRDSVFSARVSGMIGKRENATGPGKFHIRAHVGTGNISLEKGSGAQTD